MSKYQIISFLPRQLNSFLLVFVKWIIVFSAGFFIYNKLVNNETLDIVFFNKILRENINITVIFILVGFSFLNWFLEGLKWKVLVTEFIPISFSKAIEQTLGSLTVSILTPNRIGEYGAKAIYYSSRYRKKILGLNLIGNLMQLSVTVFFGIIGFFYVVMLFEIPILYYNILFLVGVVLVFLVGFSLKKQVTFKGYSLTILKQFLKCISSKTVVVSLTLALLKYLVFSHQFYFLLKLFSIRVSYIDGMALITSMYLLVSILPTIFILDVLVKGSVAVWLFSFVGANEFVILSIVLLMWLLNFGIPSIFGSYFVLNFKMNTTLDDSAV